MKKIVGILAAAAVATSVFAADVSAKVKLEGNLFKYAGGEVSAFDINKPSDQHWNPIFNLSTSTDRAGAEFAVFTGSLTSNGSWNKAFENGTNRFKIWLSPVDGLKFIFGLNGFNLNQEHINWSKSDSGIEDYGYSLNFAKDGFSLDLGLLPGWATPWMKMPNGGNVSIGATALKVAYGADFGTIGAIFVAKDTFKDLKFGAAYANSFGSVNMFANVLGYYKDSFNEVAVELYAEGSADAFAWKVFPVIRIFPSKTGADIIGAKLFARIDYTIDTWGIYLYIEDEDLTNAFKGVKPLIVKPGVKGNIGGADWDVAVKFDLDKEFAISVPVEFTFAW